MQEQKKISQPCLCVSCPKCGSVFMATVLNKEYHNDADANRELLNDLTEYAIQGYSVSFKDASSFKLDYCEHMK